MVVCIVRTMVTLRKIPDCVILIRVEHLESGRWVFDSFSSYSMLFKLATQDFKYIINGIFFKIRPPNKFFFAQRQYALGRIESDTP